MLTGIHETTTPLIPLYDCLTALLHANTSLQYRELTLQEQAEHGPATRLYPGQLILDSWRDLDLQTVPHWTSNMQQLAQIRWIIQPERFCDYVDIGERRTSSDDDDFKVGFLIVPSAGKTLIIVASKGLNLLDPEA